MPKKNFYIEIHPGEILRGILEDANVSQAELSRALGCPRKVISEICTEVRGISAEMAFKLGKAFGQSPEFWVNAQKNWEMAKVDKNITKRVHALRGVKAA